MANLWDADPIVQPASLGQFGSGNIDLTNRPRVKNPDGSVSTVRSMSANFDGQEVLLPTVSEDGRIMSDDEAIDQYRRTGKFLGKFNTVDEANAYADRLHNEQEQMYTGNSNPWDADPIVEDDGQGFDGQPLNLDIVGGRRESETPPPTAADSLSGAEKFWAGAGKSVMDNALGTAQVLSSDLGPLVAGIPGLVTREIGKRGLSDRLQQEARYRAELDAPLMDSGAGIAGNITGNLLQLIGPGVAARGTSVASAVLPTTIRGGALQGAALGAAQPVTGEGQRGVNALAGGAFGGIGAAAGNALGSLYRGARNVLAGGGLSSTDQRVANVLAREATNPNALAITPSAVPGVQRTLGEASGDSGLMALENTLRAQNRGAFEAADLSNNAARVAQMHRIAGSDADMAAAEVARNAASEGLRERAFAEGAETLARNQQADALMLPASTGMSQLRQGLRSIARSGAGNPNVQNAANAVSRALDQTGDSVGGLYNVRKYIGDLLNGRAAGDDASARAASRELIQMRDMIDENLAARAPSFPEYLDAYRTASKPINRMEVGREILGRSSSTAQDQLGNPILTPAGVARATNDLDAIAAKATDFKKAKASDILTPDDLASLRAIQDDMQRIAQRNRSATAGSQTAERLSIGERTAVRGVAGRLPWVGPLFELFESDANKRLNERLAFLMANPNEAKRVLAALPKEDAGTLRKTLNQLALATANSSQPALTQGQR